MVLGCNYWNFSVQFLPRSCAILRSLRSLLRAVRIGQSYPRTVTRRGPTKRLCAAIMQRLPRCAETIGLGHGSCAQSYTAPAATPDKMVRPQLAWTCRVSRRCLKSLESTQADRGNGRGRREERSRFLQLDYPKIGGRSLAAVPLPLSLSPRRLGLRPMRLSLTSQSLSINLGKVGQPEGAAFLPEGIFGRVGTSMSVSVCRTQ